MKPLTQQYVCEEDNNHRTFAWGEWANAVPTADGWRKVEPSARPSVPGVAALTLIPVPAQEVRDQTFEGENMYFCEPSNDFSLLTWTILNRQMKSGKVVFLARGALRQGKEKLWKLELFRDFPVLREVVFPEAIRPTPTVADSPTVDKTTADLVKQLVDASMRSWEDVDTVDSWRKQFHDWVSAGEIVQVNDDEPKSDTPHTAEDLISSLQEAVKKATAK